MILSNYIFRLQIFTKKCYLSTQKNDWARGDSSCVPTVKDSFDKHFYAQRVNNWWRIICKTVRVWKWKTIGTFSFKNLLKAEKLPEQCPFIWWNHVSWRTWYDCIFVARNRLLSIMSNIACLTRGKKPQAAVYVWVITRLPWLPVSETNHKIPHLRTFDPLLQ